MSNVIQNFSSHEAEKIRSSTDSKSLQFRQSADQLGYIFRIGLIWFGLGGLLLTFILVVFGTEFINVTNTDYEGWKLIWYTSGFLVSVLVMLQVFWAVIQGCNWVVEYQKFKICQIFAGNVALWIFMLSGGKLWALVAFIGVQILVAIIYLMLHSKQFFYTLYKRELKNNKLSWRKDLLPFQSLILISFLSGYLSFNIQVPMTSLLFGIEEAGKVGASWQLAGLISMISFAFISPHAPQIAMWAQSRSYIKIRPYFKQLVKNNILITLGLSLSLILFIYFGRILDKPDFFVNLIGRLVDTNSMIFMVIGQLALSVIMPLAVYMRAHKREPIAHLSLGGGGLTLSGSYFLCLHFGVSGIGLGFMLAQLIVLPFIILVYFKEKENYEKI